MGYKVKWVEDNLGITRNTLRFYERKKLIPEKKDKKYRDYTEEEIERLWMIKVFRGIGYSIKELLEMVNNTDFDFEASLEKKIRDLEKEEDRIKQHIGYAKQIKFTGRIPVGPSKLGTVKFGDYLQDSLDKWNINNEPIIEQSLNVVKDLKNGITNDTLEKLIEIVSQYGEIINNQELMLVQNILPKEIIKRKEKGTKDAEIQLLVKMIYDNARLMEYDGRSLGGLTKSQFVRFESGHYQFGDISKMRIEQFGKENCDFIADAIAVFGGYENADEIED